MENIGFKFIVWSVLFSVYMVLGKPAKLPGDAGHGGCGGIGGLPGKTFMVGLDRDPDFQIINKAGIGTFHYFL